MFWWSKPKKKPLTTHEAAQATLIALKQREEHFALVVEGLNDKLLSAYNLLKKEKERYDQAISEAYSAVDKYSKEVDKTRDKLEVAEAAVEAIDAYNNKLHEKWKADTALEVARRKTVEGG